jgi:hypothetical protein
VLQSPDLCACDLSAMIPMTQIYAALVPAVLSHGSPSPKLWELCPRRNNGEVPSVRSDHKCQGPMEEVEEKC